MTVEQMREALYNVYSSDNWHRTVTHGPDSQIIALYYKCKANGQIEETIDPDFESLIDHLSRSEAAREAGYEDGDELILPEGGICEGPIIIRKRKAVSV